MKLIVCDACHDIVALDFVERQCKCGKSEGHYESSLVVEVDGPCRVIGIENDIREGTRDRVEAFVIPEPHERIVRKGVTDGSNPKVQD